MNTPLASREVPLGPLTDFLVIVVGASAGGVEALEELMAGLPGDLPAAVLVVLHTSARRRSQLHEVLDRAGPLRAKEAEDGEPIQAGLVYVAVADQHLVIEAERVRLTGGPKENHTRPSIDALFRSAAHAMGERVVGVVLSGMLDDGTAGLWAIKDRGGVAIVQSPEDARYCSMPRSALLQVHVDYALSIEEIGWTLGRLANETPSVLIGVVRPADQPPVSFRLAKRRSRNCEVSRSRPLSTTSSIGTVLVAKTS